MTSKIPFALLVALVSTAALAQSTAEKTGINSATGVAPKTADFVTEAAVSDMTEIAAAKQFADQMVRDHTKTSDELKGLVSSGSVQATLPTALNNAFQQKLDKLNSATPASFKSDYDSMQVTLTRTQSRSSNARQRRRQC